MKNGGKWEKNFVEELLENPTVVISSWFIAELSQLTSVQVLMEWLRQV